MNASATLSLEESLAHLAAIAGEAHTCLRGEFVEVAPANAGEIAEILRFAEEHSLSVMPTGSGSKLDWGNPVASRIHLSLARLAALREHSWQDMTCTVEAGCPWSTLQAQLARHGQMVALDPLWPERATVGGIVATNDSGALRFKYGALRDLIIGMTVVLAGGTIAKTGGKVVKNVAGYDLHKLMTGSFGTLGVITEVNFRLHPVEQNAQNWSIAGDTRSLAEVMRRVLDSTIPVSAMQLPGLHHYGEDRLDVRLAGHPDCLAVQQEQLRAIASGLEMAAAEETVWAARETLFDDAIARDGLLLKVAMLPSQIAEVHAKLASWSGETACVTQASGVMTAAIFDHSMNCEFLIDPIREMLREGGGSVVALRTPETLRPEIDVWGCTSDALPLMREIKRRFDPHRILNPGRFVGGI